MNICHKNDPAFDGADSNGAGGGADFRGCWKGVLGIVVGGRVNVHFCGGHYWDVVERKEVS